MVAHRLLHIHLPSRGPSLYPPYTIASRLQEHLRRRLLDFKDSSANTDTDAPRTHDNIATWSLTGVTQRSKRPPEQKPTGPPPTLLSFTPLPTYTLGRRQTAPLSPDELARLQAPLVYLPPVNLNDNDKPNDTSNAVTVLPSPRGGLTTYHGPGQVVLWPVLDLRSRWHKNFTVRCYSRLLEDTTIATLGTITWLQEGNIPTHLKGFTTEDPGVWVDTAIRSPSTTTVTAAAAAAAATGSEEPEPRKAKIAALGVHLRRHVSALGTAINVNMPGPEDLSPETNPWARIVACGLEGKPVTSIHRELEARLRNVDEQLMQMVIKDLNEEVVAREWANELSRRLLCEGEVERMSPRQAARFVLHVCGDGKAAVTGQEEGERDARTVEFERRYIGWLREEFNVKDTDRIELTEFS